MKKTKSNVYILNTGARSGTMDIVVLNCWESEEESCAMCTISEWSWLENQGKTFLEEYRAFVPFNIDVVTLKKKTYKDVLESCFS